MNEFHYTPFLRSDSEEAKRGNRATMMITLY